jgi:signal transduction histidine kinase
MTSDRLRLIHRPLIVRYAVTVLFVALAVLARWLLSPVLSDREPFPTFYVSVTAAAWWGGLGPTLFALVLGYLAADWFFIAPHNAFSALNLANTGTYLFVGLAIAFFNQMMHSAQDRARASAAESRQRQLELEREVIERQRAEDALRVAHTELERRVAERTADLARANDSLQAEVTERRLAEATRNDLLRRLVVIQEEERAHLARELHDQMGQQLTALKLGLESLESPPPVDPMRAERLRKMLALTRQIGHDMHRIAWELGPVALENLDLPTALSNYAGEWSGNSGVHVQFQCTGVWFARLPPPVETSVYRVVQEALTNVAKHAKARCLSLILNRRADDVLVIVEDDGVGFDPENRAEPTRSARSLGLIGMKQRIQAVGGVFQIESTPGGGTTIFVRIPVGAEVVERSNG